MKYIVIDPLDARRRYLANSSTYGVTLQWQDGTETHVCDWDTWFGGEIWQIRGFQDDPFAGFNPDHNVPTGGRL